MEGLLAVRCRDDFAQKSLDVPVVAANDAVDAKVQRLCLVHLEQLAHQGDKAGFRLALVGCFHGSGWHGGVVGPPRVRLSVNYHRRCQPEGSFTG